jgi:hypothetical protein
MSHLTVTPAVVPFKRPGLRASHGSFFFLLKQYIKQSI